ncbi:hypothetical protein [Anaerosolibacter sp.]|uniref:hypothetical protein n=1 Tax=Anaerosolibacter sp. TaxID=1872527 RepID=UPI0039F10DF4
MNLRTTKCECGYVFTDKDVKPPLMDVSMLKNQKNFYGGTVKKLCKAKCQCGKEYLLYLIPGKTFTIKDMEPLGAEEQKAIEKKTNQRRKRK